MTENTHLLFNVYYFVLGYTSRDWYLILYLKPGLDEISVDSNTHTHTHTHEICAQCICTYFKFIILYVIVQVFCCIIFLLHVSLGNTSRMIIHLYQHLLLLVCSIHCFRFQQIDHVGSSSKVILDGFACSSFSDLCNFYLQIFVLLLYTPHVLGDCPIFFFNKTFVTYKFFFFDSRVGDHTISLVVPLVQRLELAQDYVFSLGMQLLELCEFFYESVKCNIYMVQFLENDSVQACYKCSILFLLDL